VQCSAVQCSAVQCSAVQCGAVQCSAVQCSAVQCSAVQCSAVQCSVDCSAHMVTWIKRDSTNTAKHILYYISQDPAAASGLSIRLQFILLRF
jgi:hypothetical protein